MVITTEDSLFQRFLQILAVAAMIVIQVISPLVIPPLVIYVILFTRFWWICTLYIAWYLTIDKDSPKTGNRRSDWVRSWTWWSYVKDYYPVKVVKAHSYELDPKRNYIFCYFPHGLLASCSFLSLATNATSFQKLFPRHKTYIHTLTLFFSIPFLRELGVKLGGLDVTREALENILGNKEGGNISGLVVGGAREAYYAVPGVHKIVLSERKGFVKIALKKGAPIVPVYCFGENEVFSQVQFDEKSIFQNFREIVRKTFGFSLIIPIGRKDLLGLIPKRAAMTVVVGEPIEVQKTENPTQEQIDNLHLVFEEKLLELFEGHKKYYLEDYENIHLEII